jgi:hypothetical protein
MIVYTGRSDHMNRGYHERQISRSSILQLVDAGTTRSLTKAAHPEPVREKPLLPAILDPGRSGLLKALYSKLAASS